MSALFFLGAWSFLCAVGAGLLWRLTGSRKKLYGLFIINMIFLLGVFLLYPCFI